MKLKKRLNIRIKNESNIKNTNYIINSFKKGQFLINKLGFLYLRNEFNQFIFKKIIIKEYEETINIAVDSNLYIKGTHNHEFNYGILDEIGFILSPQGKTLFLDYGLIYEDHYSKFIDDIAVVKFNNNYCLINRNGNIWSNNNEWSNKLKERKIYYKEDFKI